ncbi:hypothetical protein C1645_830846 [Glomus cerebriforme]|uniref:Uncharacterized protein n=1 Tax=Glomus cerebriforme TaxID=658196 RepID=A0A397SKI0_9GLOM|nr:hypothetical protein C1645_830846 [Glomus cerebriforme]
MIIYKFLPILASQQQEISLEDIQKAIQNTLAQQKAKNQILSKSLPSSLKLEERMKNYYIAKFLKDIDDYFKLLTPINFQNTPSDLDNKEDSYNKENK